MTNYYIHVCYYSYLSFFVHNDIVAALFAIDTEVGDVYWTSGGFECFHQGLLFRGKTNTSDVLSPCLQHTLKVVHLVRFFDW